MPTPKWDKVAEETDAKADSLLMRVVKSKWSWAIVVGALAAAWLLG